MFDSLIKLFEDKNMDLRKQLKNVNIQAVEEEAENAEVVIATLNGLS